MTDDSAVIIEEYLNDDRVMSICQANQEFSAAVNRGTHESASGCIGFVGQDDCWLPHKLDIQMRHFDSTDLELDVVNVGLAS